MNEFKIGDRVRICSERPKSDIGTIWNSPYMDSTIGKEGSVLGYEQEPYSYLIRVLVDGDNAWNYKPNWLTLLPYRFKVGDRVRQLDDKVELNMRDCFTGRVGIVQNEGTIEDNHGVEGNQRYIRVTFHDGKMPGETHYRGSWLELLPLEVGLKESVLKQGPKGTLSFNWLKPQRLRDRVTKLEEVMPLCDAAKIRELEERLEKVTEAKNGVVGDCVNLEKRCKELEEKFDKILRAHNDLMTRYGDLERMSVTLEKRCKELEEDTRNATVRYNDLVNKFISLEIRLRNLEELI